MIRTFGSWMTNEDICMLIHIYCDIYSKWNNNGQYRELVEVCCDTLMIRAFNA